jgi:Zn-dependent M16 (insulinase) family peptidase
LEDELRQMFFSTGLKGIAAEEAGRVEKLILDTLEGLAQKGIDPDTIAASVNTVEFRLRENNTGSFPRGLVLMLRALTGWLYDRDALAPLAFEAPLANIKTRLAAGEPLFENLIRASLLENRRRTRFLLKPDPQLRQREELEEQERLAQARAGMSPADLQEIIAANQRLKERQDAADSPQALAAIPSLKLEDLDREIKKIPLEVQQQGQTEIFYHDLFTNGIVYLDLGFDLHSLPQEDLPYVPLLGRALLEMGTEVQDYVKLSQRIGRSTGGIYPSTFTATLRTTGGATAWLFLRGKATTAQGGDLLDILKDVLLTARLDNRDRFRQILLEEKAGLEAQLAPMGHRMVNSRLRSRFTPAGWAAEAMGGVSFLFFLRRLAEAVEQDWPSVVARLERVRKALIGRRTMLANVTLDGANWSHFQPALSGFLDALPQGSLEQPLWKLEFTGRAEGLAIPAKVNFVGKGANLYDLGHPLNGAAFVANNFLANNWLYPRVRMQGGAYGVFGVFDHRSGVYTFLSYRDPNLLSTLDAYDQAGAFLRSLNEASLSRDEITKNIIGVIGDLDAYQLPDAKGFASLQRHLAGETDEDRQQLRDSVLAASQSDFHRLGEALEAVKSAGQVVVLGSAEAIEAASAENPGWLNVQKVQ